jgi:hypothetical protein
VQFIAALPSSRHPHLSTLLWDRMSETTLSPQEHEQLRTALFLIETLPPRTEAPLAELEPMLTRFRIRGNAAGLMRFAARSLRATPAIYFIFAGIGMVLGAFGIDIHLSRR